MNLKEVEKKYPKAYKKYYSHYRIGERSDIYGDHHPNIRCLFDFFDEEGIFISIDPPIGDSPTFCKWSYDLIVMEAGQKEYWRQDGDLVNTRIEAEEQGFLKAFEILEKKL